MLTQKKFHNPNSLHKNICQFSNEIILILVEHILGDEWWNICQKNFWQTIQTQQQEERDKNNKNGNRKAFCIINNCKSVGNLNLYLLQRWRQNFESNVSFNLTQTIFEWSIDMQKSGLIDILVLTLSCSILIYSFARTSNQSKLTVLKKTLKHVT